MKLPDSYVDCVVKHRNIEFGYRLARLNHARTHWQLYSADRTRKYDYLWKVEDVSDFSIIDYTF